MTGSDNRRLLCIDRVLPLEHKVHAAELAMAETKDNEPVLPDRLPGVSIYPLKLALFTGKRWQTGRTLRIRFLDGSNLQRQKAHERAVEWSSYANIQLNFVDDSDAEIRISFQADPGSWSAIGTDCLVATYFKPNEPTMNFGWLRDDTDDIEWRRVVVHEFGHALGAIHEHQNPKGKPIRWNEPVVYNYFSGPPNNWSKQEIYQNIIMKYSIDQLNATAFDPKSIMLYSFPPGLILGGKGTPENTDLSPGDEAFIRNMYP
jgi:Metallo-peptidase family M12B Reprolysin-like